jgi:hypothetical protein
MGAGRDLKRLFLYIGVYKEINLHLKNAIFLIWSYIIIKI